MEREMSPNKAGGACYENPFHSSCFLHFPLKKYLLYKSVAHHLKREPSLFAMRNLLPLLTLLLFSSCGTPYLGKELFGADEFVLDSYKIREGKFSILEMEGKTFEDLDEGFLVEYQDSIHEDDLLEIALYH